MIMSLFCAGCIVSGCGIKLIVDEIRDENKKREKAKNEERIQNYLIKEAERIKLLPTKKEQLEQRLRLERYLRDELIYTRDGVFILKMQDLLDTYFPVVKRN